MTTTTQIDPAIALADLEGLPQGESSAVVRARVVKARMSAGKRQLDASARAALRLAVASLDLSARAYDRLVKVARTIANLDGREAVTERHVLEAVGFRVPTPGRSP